PYERSKAAAEREVLRGVAAGLDAVIVSPAAVIGPYDFKPSQVGRLILDLYRGRLPALTGGGQSWVDVRDVAGGAIAAAERGRRGERYLLSGHPLEIAALADMVAAVAGVRRPRLVLPLGLLGAVAPAAETFSRLLGREPVLSSVSVDSLRGPLEMCHDKAARELGFAPRPLAETVAEAVTWLCDHHLGAAAPSERSTAAPANPPRSAP
ncbi:MAG: NAD-dependent epimerase/dehydratase family protein, partial [Myxococcales bacterium]|nr:NAD-dependent epimerase/dehydratase family protein [Myxococcales bacterium]